MSNLRVNESLGCSSNMKLKLSYVLLHNHIHPVHDHQEASGGLSLSGVSGITAGTENTSGCDQFVKCFHYLDFQVFSV